MLARRGKGRRTWAKHLGIVSVFSVTNGEKAAERERDARRAKKKKERRLLGSPLNLVEVPSLKKGKHRSPKMKGKKKENPRGCSIVQSTGLHFLNLPRRIKESTWSSPWTKER